MLSDPLPSGFLAVIETICTTLRPHNILWALTGSASFALQGMKLPIKDIDLQTDAVGACKIEAVLAEFVERPVSYSSTGRIRSHYGGLHLNGIQVEIIGDVEHLQANGSWSTPPDIKEACRWISYKALKIPVMSLAHEALAYERMGRLARAAEIRHFLSLRYGD
ncbi:MAG: hypothetical protein KDE59_19975 [Anaerolineales bacterium]|nr:hypothetical protein [Anaerolineales bacterium]